MFSSRFSESPIKKDPFKKKSKKTSTSKLEHLVTTKGTVVRRESGVQPSTYKI